jgi:hypothetical protein
MVAILDQYGKPLSFEAGRIEAMTHSRRSLVETFQRQMMRAKFDAAQTFTGNQNHWSNVDHLDPHSVATLAVRRILRARSRYEIIENNPYLKGTILTICNDFVGKGGPKLQITDKRISKDRQRVIEQRYTQWARVARLRQKLWRMRMAKIVDGEGFLRSYTNNRKTRGNPCTLDYQVIECDRISSPTDWPQEDPINNQVDGVRFDDYENPTQYHILDFHPGTAFMGALAGQMKGKWVRSENVVHWYRQDRGWLRGIPETTPSLPLCSILRRYTLAVIRHAETAADLTAIIESETPPGTTPWTDGAGNMVSDDPFDTFPIEMGMITNLPHGYKIKQLEAVPLGVQYDSFVGSMLREITRPLLITFNLAAGTSKDSNMASGVLDSHIYKGAQEHERVDCEEVVLDHVINDWWYEAVRIPGYLGDDFLATDNSFRSQPPEHTWRWDRIGQDHTDPSRVATALQIMHDKKFMTDRDVQEMYFNRSVEDWQDEALEDDDFRQQLTPDEPVATVGPDGKPAVTSPKKTPAKPKPKKPKAGAGKD